MRMYLCFNHKLQIIAHIMIHDIYEEKNSAVKRKLFSLYIKTKKVLRFRVQHAKKAAIIMTYIESCPNKCKAAWEIVNLDRHKPKVKTFAIAQMIQMILIIFLSGRWRR